MSEKQTSFNGDRPIEVPAEDRLGFRPAAKHVADAIYCMASPDGFVIGVEGEWGSGKSSFINLVADSLKRYELAPEIVRFLPWLISSREGLLRELFPEIIKAAFRIDSREAPVGWRAWLPKFLGSYRYSFLNLRRKKLKRLFSKFSGRLVQAGKLADLAGLPGSGAATQAGTSVIASWLDDDSLDKEKASIQRELRGLKRKIVIFIDDLDRLEPNEVTEILRLVRAVVDFPNVVFVLCYSRDVIAKNLETALSIKKGDEFLEKIVQVSFSVPRPEAFELRRMMRHDLELLFPELLSGDDIKVRSVTKRLARVIDGEGGRTLLTPRHVVRAINALRFHATPVLSDIDMPDMVWLQLIRLQSPKLYDWIEYYLIEYSAQVAGATVTSEEKKTQRAKLDEILDGLDGLYGSREVRRDALEEHLPGAEIDIEQVGTDHRRVLSIFNRQDLAQSITDRRLSSPQHFRYYFALTAPQNAISDRDFAVFLTKAQSSPSEATAYFVALADRKTEEGRLAIQPILDRLKDDGVSRVPDQGLEGLLQALAASMDVSALRMGVGDWGRNWIWADANVLLEAILKRIDGAERTKLIRKLFAEGNALGWLTDILRNETFSHGNYGNRAEPESKWILSAAELEMAAALLIERYRALTPEDLPALPDLMSILFAWAQYDKESLDEVRAKADSLTERDGDFILALEKMRGWSSTNGEVSFPLREREISRFFDFDALIERLLKLSEDSSVPALAARARALLSHVDRSED